MTSALQILKADHKKVSSLFQKFAGSQEPDNKNKLAEEICEALTIHALAEEDIFYPECRKQLTDPSLIDQALLDHANVKQQISTIEQAGDAQALEAPMHQLQRMVEVYVKEEEDILFPQVEASPMDLEEVGHKLAEALA
jgi:hemerythrin superfamily protein